MFHSPLGVLCGLRFLLGWLLAAEMEAGELDERLCHLHFDSVHFLGVGCDCQPAIYHHFAAFGHGLHYPLTQAVGDRCQLQPIKTVVESNLR